MRIRQSDLIQRLDNSKFTIFVDPFGGEWFYDKKMKTIQKYNDAEDITLNSVESKIDAKKFIISKID